jgi:high affinity sulfate transporter 1
MALFPSLHGYRRAWLRGDLVAGLTVWAVLVPEGLAYASIAGVPPKVGLAAAPAALIFYAALGSSRHLSVGPMSATAALSAAIVGTYAAAGSGQFVALTAALAVSTGVVALIAGVLRLGFVANLISEPVLKGFIIGLSLTVIVGQLPAIFGVPGVHGDFFERLWHFLKELGDTHGLTLLVGALSLALILGLRRVAPAVPGYLAAVVLGIAAAHIFDLEDHGVAIVGHLKNGLPAVDLPDVPFSDFVKLLASAVGLMLVAFAEGLGAAKTFASKHGYEIDGNRELLGLGAANLGAGLSSGMVVGGSLSKTAVNDSAGARTQLSGLAVAALTILTLLLFMGVFTELPQATLAAVVVAAVMGLIDVAALRRYYGIYTKRIGRAYGVAARPDFLAAIASLLGVLVFGTLPGLFIGIGMSLVVLIYRASRPRIAVLGRVPGSDQYGDTEKHPENEIPPGTVVLRVESGLFFANATWVRGRVLAHAELPGVKAIVLDASSSPHVDVTAVEMLDELNQQLRERGVTLLVARDIGTVRDVMREARVDGELTRVYPTLEEAVQAARAPQRTAPESP